MTEHDIRSAFGETPAAFRDQIEQTLTELEDTPMKKRYKVSTLLLAAAIAVMTLAGAAIAATQLHLTDYLKFPVSTETPAVRTAAAVMEDENIRCEIEEIVYDGYGLATEMKITSLKPDQYAVTLHGGEANAAPAPALTPLECGITGFIYDAQNKDRHTFLTERLTVQEADGAIRVYASDFQHYCRGLWMNDGYRENVLVEFQLYYALPSAEKVTLTTSLELGGSADAQKYFLTAQEYERTFEADTFELVCTDAMTHCNAYIYVPDSYTNKDTDEVSVSFSLITPDGSEYPMTVFRLRVHPTEVGDMRGLNLSGVMPAIGEMPDTVSVAMRDAQSGELIDQIECTVTATDMLVPPAN